MSYLMPIVVTAMAIVFVSVRDRLPGQDKHDWDTISAILWVAAVALWFLVIFSRHRRDHAGLDELAKSSPDYYLIADKGLSAHFDNGVIINAPWSILKSWREAGSFVVLNSADGGSPVLLPLTDLAFAEQEVLRGMLTSHLGDMAERPIFDNG